MQASSAHLCCTSCVRPTDKGLQQLPAATQPRPGAPYQHDAGPWAGALDQHEPSSKLCRLDPANWLPGLKSNKTIVRLLTYGDKNRRVSCIGSHKFFLIKALVCCRLRLTLVLSFLRSSALFEQSSGFLTIFLRGSPSQMMMTRVVREGAEVSN